MRLDKYLADAGLGTRSAVKQLVRRGSVVVDGQVCKQADAKIDENHSTVLVDGRAITYHEFEYYMLHKPAGVVSAVTDSRDKTVIELIKEEKRRDLFPVGRLDKDTEGLLLITNDGLLSNALLAPGKHVDKCYLVRVDKDIEPSLVDSFLEGVDIGDEKPTAPARLKLLGGAEAEITITEGRFHQIKRMFEAFDYKVTYLKRLRMGGLVLDPDLPCGEYRRLTEEELAALKEHMKKKENA